MLIISYINIIGLWFDVGIVRYTTKQHIQNLYE